MKGLRISADLSLPLDFVTKTCGILAQRRKGKTYTASVLAEELVAAKVPIVVLDPTGAWWGLRASANGTGPGLPVVIFGGQHGDVPLERTAGKFVADLVVDEPGFYVVDFSLFESNEAERQFATDFAERLYRAKGKPGMDFPLHLMVDEADRFIPQHSPRGDQRMLGAFEAIVRRGGLRGIGTTLISQRAAVVNKNVLEQVDSLILLRTVGPNDRKAVDGYVSSHGTDELRAELLGSLSSLALGEAWVWEPGAEPPLFERVRIRERKTFNSSATPKPGERRIEPRELADVDLGALEARMKETIERAKAEDPKELRRRIAELERTVKMLEQRPSSAETVTVEVPVEVLVEVERIPPAVVDALGAVEALAGEIGRAVVHIHESLASASSAAQTADGARTSRTSHRAPIARERAAQPPQRPVPVEAPARAMRPVRQNPDSARIDDGTLTGPEQKVLDALAWWQTLRIDTPTRLQVAMVCAYHPRTKSFLNALGSLRSAGLIDYPAEKVVTLTVTGAGAARACYDGTPADGHQLRAIVFDSLTPVKRRLLGELVGEYPEAITRDQLAARLEYHPRTKGFLNNLGALHTLSFVQYPSPGLVRADDVLFP